MRAIMVMFDSLNRRYLPPYGCDEVHAPNFKRLAEKSVTFNNSYVGSMPCMPARRELHTGRYNFLHRGWSPIEPFDDSMPEILKKQGIYTHLVSDHQHYWEDGGATYHTRYSSWEISRGQEGDLWKGDLDPTIEPSHQVVQMGRSNYAPANNMARQDAVNRTHMSEEENSCQAKTFSAGLEFLETNHKYDNWFLQIETFDPHEPFFSYAKYQELYDKTEIGREVDWPPYGPCNEPGEVIAHVREKYKALLSMCDTYLGKVLDFMDANDMWKDTMLIVNTDHGYLLGEHGWWSKTVMPTYNEIAHTPLFIWDPRSKIQGEFRNALVQTIDLAPTLLEFFDVERPKDMQGVPLRETIISDKKVRDYALFGYHGAQINITDGKYLYMKNSATEENGPIYDYTLMPMHMRSLFAPQELETATLSEPFTFTKNCPLLKVNSKGFAGYGMSTYRFGSPLYDIELDPGQKAPIDDPVTELRLMNAMAGLMRANDAPLDQFERMGFDPNNEMGMEVLENQRVYRKKYYSATPIGEYTWTEGAQEQYRFLSNSMGEEQLKTLITDHMSKEKNIHIDTDVMEEFAGTILPPEGKAMILHYLNMAGRIE